MTSFNLSIKCLAKKNNHMKTYGHPQLFNGVKSNTPHKPNVCKSPTIGIDISCCQLASLAIPQGSANSEYSSSGRTVGCEGDQSQQWKKHSAKTPFLTPKHMLTTFATNVEGQKHLGRSYNHHRFPTWKLLPVVVQIGLQRKWKLCKSLKWLCST